MANVRLTKDEQVALRVACHIASSIMTELIGMATSKEMRGAQLDLIRTLTSAESKLKGAVK